MKRHVKNWRYMVRHEKTGQRGTERDREHCQRWWGIEKILGAWGEMGRGTQSKGECREGTNNPGDIPGDDPLLWTGQG